MGTLGLANRSFGLFADEVFNSADLNRRSSEVLNRARENPVTINRNKEQFALLRRDQAARLVLVSNQFGPIVELINGAISVIEKREPPAALSWLKAFDADDLRKMTREVLDGCSAALRETGDWKTVDAVIHEWRESGLMALTPSIREAMESSADESVLPDPRSLLEGEPEVAPTGRA